jgi:hypothetical protein
MTNLVEGQRIQIAWIRVSSIEPLAAAFQRDPRDSHPVGAA